MQNQIVSNQRIEKTKAALEKKGYIVSVVTTKEEALDYIKNTVPENTTVMNGSSTTLDEIGFIDYLKSGKHNWKNLHETVLAEKDQAKQALLRKQTTITDWYLGSAHALTESGELLVASNTGSQIPSIAYNASNLLLVVGAQKIVETMEAGVERLHEVVMPLEDTRMQAAYGMGTTLNMMLWLFGEFQYSGRTRHIVLVKEVLGY